MHTQYGPFQLQELYNPLVLFLCVYTQQLFYFRDKLFPRINAFTHLLSYTPFIVLQFEGLPLFSASAQRTKELTLLTVYLVFCKTKLTRKASGLKPSLLLYFLLLRVPDRAQSIPIHLLLGLDSCIWWWWEDNYRFMWWGGKDVLKTAHRENSCIHSILQKAWEFQSSATSVLVLCISTTKHFTMS